ncbi:hypothetical protein EDB19DRAFT_106900 [Suillus lakei]|nr:hypothetical protein EDB19DRAFT_106900 [Suillus lakei]
MRSLFLSSIAALDALAVALPQLHPLSISLTKKFTLRAADGRLDPELGLIFPAQRPSYSGTLLCSKETLVQPSSPLRQRSVRQR